MKTLIYVWRYVYYTNSIIMLLSEINLTNITSQLVNTFDELFDNNDVVNLPYKSPNILSDFNKRNINPENINQILSFCDYLLIENKYLSDHTITMNYLYYKMKYLNLKSSHVLDTPIPDINLRDEFSPKYYMEAFKRLGTEPVDEKTFKFIYMVSNMIYAHQGEEIETSEDSKIRVLTRRMLLSPVKESSSITRPIIPPFNLGAPVKRKKPDTYVEVDEQVGQEHEDYNRLKRGKPTSLVPRDYHERAAKRNPIYVYNDDTLTDKIFDFEFGFDTIHSPEATALRKKFIEKMVTTDLEENAYLDRTLRSQAGFTIENWLCENMVCPYCGNKSLHS